MAAEVDAEAKEEYHACDVGVGFGDGYDLVWKQTVSDLRGISDEATLVDPAIEADALQLRTGEGRVGENDLIQVVIVSTLIVIISCPVVDGEEGIGIVPVDVCEAEEHAIATGAEVDG